MVNSPSNISKQLTQPITLKSKVYHMLHLTMHTTHFVYGYYGDIGHMVRDHTDHEIGNPLSTPMAQWLIHLPMGW